MSIARFTDKIKSFKGIDKSAILLSFVIIFVGISAFFLGRISAQKVDSNSNIEIVKNAEASKAVSYYPKSIAKSNPASSLSENAPTGKYVASKNGKLYYRVGCGGSKRIVPANQIFFTTQEEAEQAGYKASATCTP